MERKAEALRLNALADEDDTLSGLTAKDAGLVEEFGVVAVMGMKAFWTLVVSTFTASLSMP